MNFSWSFDGIHFYMTTGFDSMLNALATRLIWYSKKSISSYQATMVPDMGWQFSSDIPVRDISRY